MVHEFLVWLGLATATLQMPAGAQLTDLTKLKPPFDPTYLLGGRFTFLGSADEGSPGYTGWPPPGVVKVYYPNQSTVGYWRVAPSSWEAFKKAWDRFEWSPMTHQETTGTYPIATSAEHFDGEGTGER